MGNTQRNSSQVIAFNKAHYGQLLSAARRKAGLTQQKLADILDINKNIVTHWEAGRVKPDLNLVPAICQALHISLEEFFQLPIQHDSLTSQEKEMLRHYRAMSSRERLIIDSAFMKLVELSKPELRAHCKNDFFVLTKIAQCAAPDGRMALDPEHSTAVFVRKNRNTARAKEIVTTLGDEMKPRFTAGHDLLVEEADDINIDEFGLFNVDGRLMVRQRKMDSLHALSASIPDTPLNSAKSVQCRGRIIGVLSKNDYPTPEETAVLEELYPNP